MVVEAHPLFPYLEKCLAIPTYPLSFTSKWFFCCNNNCHNHLIQTGFLKYTEAIATSLISLVTNFPEICAFIIGFSFTAWTRMRPSLAH